MKSFVQYACQNIGNKMQIVLGEFESWNSHREYRENLTNYEI